MKVPILGLNKYTYLGFFVEVITLRKGDRGIIGMERGRNVLYVHILKQAIYIVVMLKKNIE